jgi:multidrug resistance efflux pump
MDDLDDIRHRLWISKLQAKVALRQIEAASLTHEIGSPLTAANRREEALERRETLLDEASGLQSELDNLRTLFPDLARY